MLVRRRAHTAKLSLLFAAMSVVCLAQFPPPSDSGQYAAKVVTMTGSVSVLKDMVPIALMEGGLVQVQQMIVTGPDGHATFQVSDGSTFEVFPNSHLVFRKNAWNPKDMIDLLMGRIRVHIEHLLNVPNPNRVLTPTAVISVRGTTFDITVDGDDETTTVEVEDGLVEVRHALLPSVSKMLGPGDSIKVYKSEPLQARLLDKGTFWHYALKGIQDAANLASMRGGTRGVLGTSGGSGGSVGDTGKGSGPTSGTSNGGSSSGGTTAVPPPPPPPPPPGGLLGTRVHKHHTFKQVMLGTVKYLGKLVGIGPMTVQPVSVF